MKAIVIGGTGAVGRHVVAFLLESSSVEKVTLIGRSQYKPEGFEGSEFTHPKLVQKTVNMDQLGAAGEFFQDHDLAFCCLGTTRKDAGSAEAFRKVDLDYVSTFGKLAKDSGIKKFGLVSAQGANINSFLLYPQTKGEAEKAITDLGFSQTIIFRPGLIGRGEKARGVERFLEVVSFGYAATPAAVIGKALVVATLQENSGTHIINTSGIVNLSKGNL